MVAAHQQLETSLDLIGHTVAKKYRIRRLLGEGGMGAVFEAENLEIGKRVAMKRLRPEVVERSPTARDRFLREARIAAELGDPRIVDVYDVIDEGGLSAYIVMELLTGEPLSERLSRETTLSLGDALEIAREVLGVLVHAHERGIIHRDIKPENIFLTRAPGRAPAVKLLDFGISKHMMSPAKLTASNALVGSPFYMSPEQALCSPDLDHRSDLFSTGAVLFTCLTGQVLFGGTSIGKILARLLTEEPPLLRSVARDASPELERVIDRALAPKPDDRFQSAAEMWEALAPFVGSTWRVASESETVITESWSFEDKTAPVPPAREESGVEDTAIRAAAEPLDVDVPGSRYEVRALIGYGSAAEVYEVWDAELGRAVALKRIRRDQQSKDNLTRLHREAQITAQLEHPNIIPIHDCGRLESGDPYFTMKRVTGMTLGRLLALIAEGDRATIRRYDLQRLGLIYLSIVQAIAYAHARGVVHCDLNPENVLIGAHGEVLVTDWGWAQIVERRREQLVNVLDGACTLRIAGALPYLSPELASGDPIDERSDIYALGAILYHLLTLTAPFAVKNRRELVAQIRANVLVPPRDRAPDREVVGELEEICLKAMSPDPAARFTSVAELEEAIQDQLTQRCRARAGSR